MESAKLCTCSWARSGRGKGPRVSGLREQQKARRRHAISESAIGLFESQGYQATTMEQIAKAAGVSVPTVFAYFGSKQEILLEMLQEADRQAFSDTRRRLDSFASPVDVFCHLEEKLVESAFKALTPALWQEILPLLMPQLGEDQSRLPAAYKRVNDVVVAELNELMQALVAAGKLRADLDTHYAAYLLNDYSHLLLLRLTRADQLDLQAHLGAVRHFCTLLFEGMRPSD